MVKKRGEKLMWFLMIIVMLIALIVAYFRLPFSTLKSSFNKNVSSLISYSAKSTEFFEAIEIVDLPIPVKRYFETCGFIGKPKMEYMKIVYKDVDFLLSVDKPPSKIDYIQYTFVKEPARLAFIDTSMYGIPFQGIDSYVEGIGGMKGVIAKTVTLFNEIGADMDTACLVNILSESLLVPNIALQDYITWEEIDDTHAKAAISYYGISVSGIFAFSENGEMISFTTNDRWLVGTDGTKAQIPWSIFLNDYEESNGIKQPTSFKSIWHYENGDSVYFNNRDPVIEYH